MSYIKLGFQAPSLLRLLTYLKNSSKITTQQLVFVGAHGSPGISIAVDIAACTKKDAFCVLQVIVNNHGSLGANLVACGRISLARRHFFSVCFRESAAAATEHLVRHHSTAVSDNLFHDVMQVLEVLNDALARRGDMPPDLLHHQEQLLFRALIPELPPHVAHGVH